MKQFFVVPLDVFPELSFGTRQAWRKFRSEVNEHCRSYEREGIMFIDSDVKTLKTLKDNPDMANLSRNQKLIKAEKELEALQTVLEKANKEIATLNKKLEDYESRLKESDLVTEGVIQDNDSADNSEVQEHQKHQYSRDVVPVMKVVSAINEATDQELESIIDTGYFKGESRLSVKKALEERGYKKTIQKITEEE
jgi:septal ring factor EnvC (AmiA/AmiB activator)